MADFRILIGGRCDRKWWFSVKETAFAGGPKFSMGAMLMKIVILLKENWSHITKLYWICFNGGDVDKNHHFIEGKLVAHYQILNIFELVAYGLLFQCRHVDENYHLWKEIGCTWPHFINLIWSGNDARELTIFKKRNHIWRGTNVVMGTMFMKIIILLKKKDRT